MPIREHKNYFRWGNQKKYYFNNPAEKVQAKNKALKQAEAAYAHGYKGGASDYEKRMEAQKKAQDWEKQHLAKERKKNNDAVNNLLRLAGGALSEKELEDKYKHYGFFSKPLKKHRERKNNNVQFWVNPLAEGLNMLGLGMKAFSRPTGNFKNLDPANLGINPNGMYSGHSTRSFGSGINMPLY